MESEGQEVGDSWPAFLREFAGSLKADQTRSNRERIASAITRASQVQADVRPRWFRPHRFVTDFLLDESIWTDQPRAHADPFCDLTDYCEFVIDTSDDPRQRHTGRRLSPFEVLTWKDGRLLKTLARHYYPAEPSVIPSAQMLANLRPQFHPNYLRRLLSVWGMHLPIDYCRKIEGQTVTVCATDKRHAERVGTEAATASSSIEDPERYLLDNVFRTGHVTLDHVCNRPPYQFEYDGVRDPAVWSLIVERCALGVPWVIWKQAVWKRAPDCWSWPPIVVLVIPSPNDPDGESVTSNDRRNYALMFDNMRAEAVAAMCGGIGGQLLTPLVQLIASYLSLNSPLVWLDR